MAAAKPPPVRFGSEGQPSPALAAGAPVAIRQATNLQAAGTGLDQFADAGIPRPYTVAPARMDVKIYSTDGADEYVCSGTVVNSRSKRMVDTAGHCVSDGAGHYHSKFLVVPAFSSRCSGCGDAPYGKWTARTVTTRADWLYSANHKQDLGYIVTNDLDGRRIADVVGGVGTKFNVSRAQQWGATGYPAEDPFDGYNQYVCLSGRLADDNPDPGPGPLTIGIACNMTGGSSGGGWMTGPYKNGIGYLNGHNSYHIVSGPLRNANHMYGPYYGNEALALFNYTTELG